jgi:hypothetical protein
MRGLAQQRHQIAHGIYVAPRREDGNGAMSLAQVTL